MKRLIYFLILASALTLAVLTPAQAQFDGFEPTGSSSSALDSTSLFSEKFAWLRGTLRVTPLRPNDTIAVLNARKLANNITSVRLFSSFGGNGMITVVDSVGGVRFSIDSLGRVVHGPLRIKLPLGFGFGAGDSTIFSIQTDGGTRLAGFTSIGANLLMFSTQYVRATSRFDAPYYADASGNIWGNPSAGKIGIGGAGTPADSLFTVGAGLGGVHIYGGVRIEGGITDGNGQIAAIVTAGAGDSVTVTIPGILPTSVVVVSYIGGTTAPTIHPWSNAFAANTLTIYGDSGRKLSYIRIRK